MMDNKLSFIKKIVACFFTMIFLVALSLLYLYFHDLRVVIPNQVYRSNQLSKSEFISVIDYFHIKSVINLRGRQSARSQWYRQEIDAMRLTHVVHYDIPLNSELLPPLDQLQRLVIILEQAPRPMLVHCASGVDRSGLAAAISLILNNAPLSEADKQISLRYFVVKKNSVGKLVLQRYQQWLKQNHLQTSRINFLTWLGQLQEGKNY